MQNNTHIPEELQGAFKRLIKLLPSRLRTEAGVKVTVLEHLKVYGEDFVREGIKKSLTQLRGHIQAKKNKRSRKIL